MAVPEVVGQRLAGLGAALGQRVPGEGGVHPHWAVLLVLVVLVVLSGQRGQRGRGERVSIHLQVHEFVAGAGGVHGVTAAAVGAQ